MLSAPEPRSDKRAADAEHRTLNSSWNAGDYTLFTGTSNRPSRRCALILALILLLAACSPSGPSSRIMLGEVVIDEDFTNPTRWQVYRYPEQNVDFRPEAGGYRAQAWDGGFSWVLYDAARFSDVVIQVDTEQLSSDRNNAYGLMCRASPTDNGDGYYFFISGDGYYTIRVGTRSGINDLIPWTATTVIQQDRAINRLRVACVGDYLALWVNGEFIAETRDTRFSVGYIGLTAAVPEGGNVDVTFDALRAWTGTISSQMRE